ERRLPRRIASAALAGAALLSVALGQLPQGTEEQRVKERYLALARGWAEESILTRSEQEAMARGRDVEGLMMSGRDDPLARRVLAAGEPSFDALAALYPGKVLDRTVLGSWSDPRAPLRDQENEFVVWWNGAVSADLMEGPRRPGARPVG